MFYPLKGNLDNPFLNDMSWDEPLNKIAYTYIHGGDWLSNNVVGQQARCSGWWVNSVVGYLALPHVT